jgi:hypothetical protein
LLIGRRTLENGINIGVESPGWRGEVPTGEVGWWQVHHGVEGSSGRDVWDCSIQTRVFISNISRFGTQVRAVLGWGDGLEGQPPVAVIFVVGGDKGRSWRVLDEGRH